MILLTTFHCHSEAEEVCASVSECQDCQNHVHHDGHIRVLKDTVHKCVFCQLQSIPYLTSVTLSLSLFIVPCRIGRLPDRTGKEYQAYDVINSRAPPVA